LKVFKGFYLKAKAIIKDFHLKAKAVMTLTVLYVPWRPKGERNLFSAEVHAYRILGWIQSGV